MGLVLEPDGSHVVLTDILGSEDALGDMDFKVAGDAEGITAFQVRARVGALIIYYYCFCCFFIHCFCRRVPSRARRVPRSRRIKIIQIMILMILNSSFKF